MIRIGATRRRPFFPNLLSQRTFPSKTTLPFLEPITVDILKECRDCNRGFLFFAEEQQYWYEELGFHIDADCVRCPECRKNDQTTRQRFQRYSESIGMDDLSDDSLAILIDDAVFLWEHGMLKNQHNLGRLKNLANRQIPNHPTTEAINKLVESF